MINKNILVVVLLNHVMYNNNGKVRETINVEDIYYVFTIIEMSWNLLNLQTKDYIKKHVHIYYMKTGDKTFEQWVDLVCCLYNNVS